MKSLMLAFIIIITAHVCFGGTIHVPGDRASIQSGIDAASEGDTVLIGAGLYVENITIDNPIHLIGQEKNSTIIDGAAAGDVILITSDNVHVANMSITNGGAEIPLEEAWDAGIKLEAVDSCLVENCKLFGNNAAGMSVGNSSFNVVERCIFINNYAGIYFYTDIGSLPVSNNHHNLLRYNKIYDNEGAGIGFTHGMMDHNNNLIHANYFARNYGGLGGIMFRENEISFNNFCENEYMGISLTTCIVPTDSNMVHHNSFIENNGGGAQASDDGGDECVNYWYEQSTSEGNYWYDYTGSDNNGDGIGDTLYTISGILNSRDLFPLMQAQDYDGDYIIDSVDNCTFVSNYDQADIDFDLIGDACDDCIDSDGDGYGDEGYPDNTCQVDNCPGRYNPDQADIDEDGLGDVCDYICGDSNHDNDINVSDAVHIINYIFIGGDPPYPLDAGDANCDTKINVSDAVWIINYVFIGGNLPGDTDGDGIIDC